MDNAQELLFPQEPLCQPDLREDNAQAGVGDLDNKDNLPFHSVEETKWWSTPSPSVLFKQRPR